MTSQSKSPFGCRQQALGRPQQSETPAVHIYDALAACSLCTHKRLSVTLYYPLWMATFRTYPIPTPECRDHLNGLSEIDHKTPAKISLEPWFKPPHKGVECRPTLSISNVSDELASATAATDWAYPHWTWSLCSTLHCCVYRGKLVGEEMAYVDHNNLQPRIYTGTQVHVNSLSVRLRRPTLYSKPAERTKLDGACTQKKQTGRIGSQ
jgi:hypothetical protein